MAQYAWPNCPEHIKKQIEELVRFLRETLGDILRGVYLHGSLVMGCFNPQRSDIDILAVTENSVSPQSKALLAKYLLETSGSPRPIEISILSTTDLHPWRHPTPFDFHFSEDWRKRMIRQIREDFWKPTANSTQFDADLAAHITILKRRGVCLYGEAIASVFPEIPPADYLKSILSDFADCVAQIHSTPVYSILNMLRVYYYLVEGVVASKQEAGQWAIASAAVPKHLRDPIGEALAAYAGEQHNPYFDSSDLRRLSDFIGSQVRLKLTRKV